MDARPTVDTVGKVLPTRSTPRVSLTVWVWATLLGYFAVVIALTCLKAWFKIGLLWHPENQRTRELRLVPLSIVTESSTVFGITFDILGNVAFFVPLGAMMVVATRRLWVSVGLATALSLFIEVSQYLLSLGRTDVTDLICNAIGALIGAAFAARLLRGSPATVDRWSLRITVAVTALVVGFVLLVAFSPWLGSEAAQTPL